MYTADYTDTEIDYGPHSPVRLCHMTILLIRKNTHSEEMKG